MDTLNKKFCCITMDQWVNDPDCPFSYNNYDRYYTMSASDSLMKKNNIWPCYKVYFCPHCGAKLPTRLVSERLDIIEKEYGIENPYDTKEKKLIPKEFMSEEWWKKRGL